MDAPPPDAQADPIESAWEKVDRAWEDDAAHRRFIALCLSLDRLAEAGTRYRQEREGNADRRAEAEKRIEEILTAATQRMQLVRSDPTPDLRWAVRLAAFVVSAGMIAAAAWLWLRGG